MFRKPQIIWPAGIFSSILLLAVVSSVSFFQIRKKCLERFDIVFPVKRTGGVIGCGSRTIKYHKIIHPGLTDSVFQNFQKLKLRLDKFRGERMDEAIVINLKNVSYTGIIDLVRVCARTNQSRFTISDDYFYIFPDPDTHKKSLKGSMCLYKY